MALMPSQLPHMELLWLDGCHNVCDEHVEALMDALPELEVITRMGDIMINNEDADDVIEQWKLA